MYVRKQKLNVKLFGFSVISLLRFATELAAALDDAIRRVPAQRRKHTLVVARPAKQEAK
jgi:hypothetical protein